MNLIFWVPGLLAAAAGLLLPFRAGFAVLLLLLPISNSYASAAAAAVIVGRWMLLELPALQVTREQRFTVGAVLVFSAAAILQSLVTSDDLARLTTESIQWLLGVALFCAIVLSGIDVRDRLVAMGFIVGAAVLAVAQFLLRTGGVEIAEDSATSLLITESNNYTAIYLLFGLVTVPAMVRPASWWLPLLLIAGGLAAISYNESRGMLLVAALVVAGWITLRSRHTTVLLGLMAVVLGTLGIGAAFLLRDALYNPSTVLSLGDFETNFSNLERLGLILHSLDFFGTHPLGAGLGASSQVFPDSPYTVGSYPTSHNTFAMLIVELGWLGVLGYVAIVCVLLGRVIRGFFAGSVGALLPMCVIASTLFDAVFFNGTVALVFWSVFALALRDPGHKRQLVALQLLPQELSPHRSQPHGAE